MVKEFKEGYENMSSENEIRVLVGVSKGNGIFMIPFVSFSRKNITKTPKGLRIMKDGSAVQKLDRIP